MRRLAVAMFADEAGASLVEYALIIALITVVCVAAVSYFGKVTANDLGNAGNKL